jgi:hypothetical protein
VKARQGLFPCTIKTFGLSIDIIVDERQRQTRKASTDAINAGDGLNGKESHLLPRKNFFDEKRIEPSSLKLKKFIYFLINKK